MASANDVYETSFQLPDLSGLSDEERTQLLAVMKKAQEFEVSEEKQLMRQPLEGLLYKYTNVMKGWQYRWFVLNPELGRLEYYEKEEHKKLLRPRGCLTLANATVCPSDEDSQTFYVNASNGESFRLKAFDAKERQHWVNRLRATAEYHSEISGNNLISGLLGQTSNTNTINSQRSSVSSSTATKQSTDLTDSLFHGPTSLFSPRSRPVKSVPASNSLKMQPPPSVSDTDGHIDASLKTCIDSLTKVRRLHKDLTGQIEMLPASGEVVCCLDKEMLLLKATSSATIACLEQCLAILQRQAATVHTLQSNGSTVHSQHVAISNTRSESDCELLITPSLSQTNTTSLHTTTANTTVVRVKRCDEVQDSCIYTDTDLDGVDEHKTVILHLLSQLKLGMDLTKVVLPTFILEKRSLLELFADCMAHPELFLRITDEPTPEARMMAVVEWYLTSFHAGRQGSVAKKPYNPIIGEYFHCSWSVQSNSTSCDPRPSSTDSCTSPRTGTRSPGHKLYYCAEQVSHHPPISAFYFESPEKQMYMDASFWTRSKFMGMSIGVALIGRARLRLLSPGGAAATAGAAAATAGAADTTGAANTAGAAAATAGTANTAGTAAATTGAADTTGAANTSGSVEEYEFSLPSVYARSILTVPWVELGDKVTIHCEQTGYTAAIIFHTKPFYGGRLHKVTGEVKNSAGDTVSRIAGEWNSTIEFTLSNGLTRTIDTSKLAINCKFVRPVDLQDSMESRRLWRHVTDSLRNNDIDQATEHKRILEDAQREGERLRKESRLPFPTKYFHRVDDEWVFKATLHPTQTHPSV